MVAPNPLPITSLLLGEVSVLLPVMCSWEGSSVTPLYPRWWCILWHWPMEFYVPTRSEIGLVAWSHFWWLSSPSGFFVARQCGVPGGPWGVGSLVAYWCDGFWPSSSADSFSVHSACLFRCAFQDGAKSPYSSPGWRSSSSWELRLAAATTTGNVQGFESNFHFFVFWAVITKCYKWMKISILLGPV